jgi:hypothetical protein
LWRTPGKGQQKEFGASISFTDYPITPADFPLTRRTAGSGAGRNWRRVGKWLRMPPKAPFEADVTGGCSGPNTDIRRFDDICQLERARRLRGRRSARSDDRKIMVWKTQALCATVRLE